MDAIDPEAFACFFMLAGLETCGFARFHDVCARRNIRGGFRQGEWLDAD